MRALYAVGITRVRTPENPAAWVRGVFSKTQCYPWASRLLVRIDHSIFCALKEQCSVLEAFCIEGGDSGKITGFMLPANALDHPADEEPSPRDPLTWAPGRRASQTSEQTDIGG
jgi:hypothetical protein